MYKYEIVNDKAIVNVNEENICINTDNKWLIEIVFDALNEADKIAKRNIIDIINQYNSVVEDISIFMHYEHSNYERRRIKFARLSDALTKKKVLLRQLYSL